MLAAIKAEFRKMLTVRSLYIMLAFSLLMVGLFAFYGDGIKASPASLNDTHKLAGDITNAISALAVIGSLVGVLLMTHEYRYNTIMYTLTASNSRLKTLLAKVFTVTVFIVCYTVLFATLSPLFAALGVQLHGGHLVAQDLLLSTVAWRVLLFGWVAAMLNLALAVIIRNQIGTIVTMLLLPSTVEPLLSLVLKAKAAYLPYTVMHQIIDHNIIPEPSPHIAMSYGRAAVWGLGYVIVAWIIAAILFVRRDAN